MFHSMKFGTNEKVGEEEYINEKSTEFLQCFWLPNLDLNQGPSD